MYGDVVLGVRSGPDEDHDPFETVIHGLKHERYHQDIEDTKLTRRRSQGLVVRFKAWSRSGPASSSRTRLGTS
jgi:pyruvate,orthophosphate dikinase